MIFKLCNDGKSVVGIREDGVSVSYLIEAEEYQQWLAQGNVPEPEFTEEELAQQAKEQARQEALTTIAQLEASQLRSIRELMLDANNEYAKAKLAEIEAKIQEERTKL